MFTPAVERPWRDAWPLVARPGDGNPWNTGMCWLFCRRTGVAVLWVGSVTTPGATGNVYACGPCLAELDHMVRAQAYERDGGDGERTRRAATLAVPAYVAVTGGCEHRTTEHRGGKTYCRGCARQIYL
ncbi:MULTISPECIES: hypothetical protein [Streptomyces]|uniref:Uncharacterized protein n=1 Tax=Streptomyces fradiae ATCC 10745 = DSM 40063 TaxID=1319510 RepID=A0A1Y2P2W5_STRFR|nr:MULTISPECIES: hypothetical protein [Streptomyces]KAF0651047.1 hypothetical protein K701_04545 [Streptomyces fradiae ATCC 10745 = DSM 40063]OSY53920.1 hypothetical protein BG846_00405 [Streptomyces fradiae ATCC 10745 = DSM 40063]QEV12800.1 hypothetical protein CP974_13180 [Streptomyces fradiae ATCC 10745 = DSM 40063]